MKGSNIVRMMTGGTRDDQFGKLIKDKSSG